MKALVTGGGGFVGSWLVRRLLDKGHQVRVLDVQKGRLRHLNDSKLEFVGLEADPLRGGMLNQKQVRQSMRGVDVVYHLAINWDGHSWRGRIPLPELFNINVRGTWNLLESAKSFRVKQFLFSSSIAVYGKRNSPVMDEDTDCRPELWKGGPGPSYAIVKLATERLCLMYNRENRLPVTVFRIDVAFDDREYQDLDEQTIRRVRKGNSIEVVRDEGGACVHVDDIAQAFLLATFNKKSEGQIFNISNPRAYLSDVDVIRIVADSLRSKSKIKVVRGSGLTGPKIGSIRRAQRVLGWKPHKTKKDVAMTIRRMVRLSQTGYA